MDTLAWLTLLPLWLIGGGVLLTRPYAVAPGRVSCWGLPCCCWAWAAPCASRRPAAPAHRQCRPLRAGLGPGAGVLPGLIKQAFAQKVPLVMGIFSACMMGAGRWGPASPRSSPPGSTGPRRWRCGACRCCWPWAGSAGEYGCPRRRWQCQAAASSASSACPQLAADKLLWHHQQRLRHRRCLARAGLHGAGLEPQQGGELVAWLALAQTVSGLGLPLLAARRLDRRPWMGLAIAMQLAGFGGLWLAPTAAPILWCMLCGAGLGGSFSLIMVIALDHLPDPRRAGTLSALMQGIRLHAGSHRPLGGGPPASPER